MEYNDLTEKSRVVPFTHTPHNPYKELILFAV